MKINIELVIAHIIPFVFIAFGLILIVIRYKKNKFLKNVCTEEVVGEIIEVDSRASDSSWVYSPIYEINFNGTKIKIKPNEYTNFYNFKIGKRNKLLINPLTPQQFIYPHKRIDIFIYIFGILCIIGGMFPIICMLNII